MWYHSHHGKSTLVFRAFGGLRLCMLSVLPFSFGHLGCSCPVWNAALPVLVSQMQGAEKGGLARVPGKHCFAD